MGLVASLNRGLPPVECNPGQVANIHVPLSPSSIIWYQPTGLAAGKVTVGLASHWPHGTDISGSPPTGSRPRRGRLLLLLLLACAKSHMLSASRWQPHLRGR